jgi:sporulation protein YlmC with PRC-barrel domain/CBS domain-containing protein
MESSEKSDFFFSRLLGKKVFDPHGRVIGKIMDIAVRWAGARPVATSIKFTKGLRSHFDASLVTNLCDSGLFVHNEYPAISTSPPTEDSIYVSKWLLDKQIIDRTGARLVRVNDIKLCWINKEIVLTAVDIGIKGLFRRLGLEWLVKNWPDKYVDWERIIPLESQNDYLQLRGTSTLPLNFPPADMAGIIEQLAHQERLRLIDSLDDEYLVKVLLKISPRTKTHLFFQLDEAKAASLLSKIPANETAALLRTLPKAKADALLYQLPRKEPEIQNHLSYRADTAGALMTSRFTAFSAKTTVAEALASFRLASPPNRWLNYLYVIDEAQVLQGVCSCRKVLTAGPTAYLGEIMQNNLITLPAVASRKEIIEHFFKYHLLALPVVDDQQVILGIITVDAALSLMTPNRTPILSPYSGSLPR